MLRWRAQRGMTLVELMVGTAILVGGGGALLIGMRYALIHADYLYDFQLATNAVQSRMEELSSLPFDTLLTDLQYAPARTAPTGQCMGLNEDFNCNGVLNGGEDRNGNNQLDEPIPGARLHVRIDPFPPGPGTKTVLTVHISACIPWRGRNIGEDRNCNGVLDAGEDTNANGWLDSPAEASTRVADND